VLHLFTCSSSSLGLLYKSFFLRALVLPNRWSRGDTLFVGAMVLRLKHAHMCCHGKVPPVGTPYRAVSCAICVLS
jgi:hypothetical protein